VEDDVELRRLYRLALTFEGYDVEEAGDGIEALRQIDQQVPDLLILDLGLPALSGLAVQQDIAQHASTMALPIIIVTGSAADLGGIDVDCVLRKPVSPEELIRAVRRCMPQE
jgi:DNA-binding response OmpR family regulator